MEENTMNYQYGEQILKSYLKQGKITQEQFNILKDDIALLFDTNSKSIENFKNLKATHIRMKKLVANCKEWLNHQEATNNTASEKAEELSRNLKSSQTIFESTRTSLQNRNYQWKDIQKECKNTVERAQQKIRKINQVKKPEVEALEQKIKDSEKSTADILQLIETKQKGLQQKNQRNIQLLKLIDQLNQIYAKRQEEYKNNKDLPELSKASNKNLEEEIQKLEKELKLIEEDLAKKKQVLQQNRRRKQLIQDKLKAQKDGLKADVQAVALLDDQISILTSQKSRLDKQIMILNQRKAEIQINDKEFKKSIKSVKDQISVAKKHKDKTMRQTKKIEKNQVSARNQNEKDVKEVNKIKKETLAYKNQIQQIEEQILKLGIQIKKLQILSNLKKDSCQTKKNEESATKAKIDQLKVHLDKLKAANQQYKRNVNSLTAMRETMARRASQANSQVRETAEQLKIKQLQILDLTKKYQQTQSRLDNFKALYQQVKSARNKYVNLIQNSSQDLAQLKQRIKNLDNQLQILKNQSAEKDRTLQEYTRMLRKETHNRDQIKKQKNKCDLKRKQKQQLVNQNINEIEKQSMIMQSLYKEMQNLKLKNEDVCQSRNYTGIQLIDRNDQLCVLYQKANKHQNKLRVAQIEVKALEDSIRMCKIQNEQNLRQIELARKRVTQVPKLAQKVVELNEQYNIQLQRQQELCKKLQDPKNKNRWRQLQGEYPDQETLNAKINILEERFNSKKETLLEKELILDQITNLSDKLRKDALDGRLGTLELSQKINQFQTVNKDLTRKMKAIISQLSMLQANIIKLNQERERLQQINKTATQNFQKGIAPTPQMQIQYLNMVRNRKRYEEERLARQHQLEMQQKYPPFATKTTAQRRKDTYIPQDGIGLQKVYGAQALFMPTLPGANIRHFRKPKPVEIQI